ncbi:hypothetical protein [Acidisphaera rubrifaciens]|uniref:hypothetical protein n=1 Tax=Acidisphaera rubrifaciens TaxID=50715 RepID=UPI0011DE45FD|nr:hypothetical protein [Acidisphaera rubrifaciens]
MPEGAVVLIEEGLPAAAPTATVFSFPAMPAAASGPHPAGCACCVSRTPAAEALRRLFLARVRGETAFFSEVTVLGRPTTVAALRDALRDDPGLAGWFRAAIPD